MARGVPRNFKRGGARFPISVPTEKKTQIEGPHGLRLPIFLPKSSEDQKKRSLCPQMYLFAGRGGEGAVLGPLPRKIFQNFHTAIKILVLFEKL